MADVRALYVKRFWAPVYLRSTASKLLLWLKPPKKDIKADGAFLFLSSPLLAPRYLAAERRLNPKCRAVQGTCCWSLCATTRASFDLALTAAMSLLTSLESDASTRVGPCILQCMQRDRWFARWLECRKHHGQMRWTSRKFSAAICQACRRIPSLPFEDMAPMKAAKEGHERQGHEGRHSRPRRA